MTQGRMLIASVIKLQIATGYKITVIVHKPPVVSARESGIGQPLIPEDESQ